MAEKVKRLMVTLDKAKQGANKALSDFEAELKSLQCEVDALEETTTGLRTKLVLTQAQLSLTKEEVQRRQEREEKLQAELMTAKTEMAVMQNTQKDLEGQLAAASSSCKAMTAALKGAQLDTLFTVPPTGAVPVVTVTGYPSVYTAVPPVQALLSTAARK